MGEHKVNIRVVQGHDRRLDYHEWVNVNEKVFANVNGVQNGRIISPEWQKWGCNNPDCSAFAFVSEQWIARALEDES